MITLHGAATDDEVLAILLAKKEARKVEDDRIQDYRDSQQAKKAKKVHGAAEFWDKLVDGTLKWSDLKVEQMDGIASVKEFTFS